MKYKKKKDKKELKYSDIIFRYRHFLAFLTTIMFLFLYGMSAFADTFTGSILSSDLDDWYYMHSTYYGLDLASVKNHADANGFDSTKIITSWSAMSSSTQGFSHYFDGTLAYSFTILDGITNSTSGIDYEFSDVQYHAFMTFSSDSTNSVSLAFSGTGNFGYVFWNNHNWVCSDQPFVCGVHQRYPGGYNYNIVKVDTVSANGLYLLTNYDGFRTYFTDLPVYIPTSDGSSGFTTFTASSTDFSFANNNYDFNYIMTEDLYTNRNAPPEVVESDVRYNLTFRDSTYYSGGGLNAMWHNNNFTFTEYQLNNPVDYRLKFSYRVDFSNNIGTDTTFYYTPRDDIQLAYFLGQSNRLGTGSRVAVPLSADWFLDGNGRSLRSAIVETINAVTGTNVEYVNPNGLFENIIDYFVSVDNYVFGDGSGSPLQVVTNVYGGVITKFTIYGEVSLYDVNNSNYESYSYKDYHDFLTGNGGVLSTNNTIPPYENSPDPTYTQVPSGSSGGGYSAQSGSAIALIEKGAITVNMAAGNYPGFQLSAQGWTDYGTFYQTTGNTLMELARGSGNFGQVVQAAGAGIPPQIWTLVLAGVGTSICLGIWHGVRNH